LFLVALINTLVFLGFPGSIMFVAEILFFFILFWPIPSIMYFFYHPLIFISSNVFFPNLNECFIWII
jgi:hypothetical protein